MMWHAIKRAIFPDRISRYRASILHFFVSCLVLSAVLLLILSLWYPAPYFQAEGTWRVVKILIPMDIVLGPLLTLVLFKQGKPGMKFDLSVIASVQIIALLYGGYTVFSERPLFLAFIDGGFKVVSTSEVDVSKAEYELFKSRSWTGPVPVSVRVPIEGKEVQQMLALVTSSGKEMHNFARYYTPFKLTACNLKTKLDITKYTESAEEIDKVKQWQQQNRATSLAFFPFYGHFKNVIVAVDIQQNTIIGTLAIDPLERRRKHAEKKQSEEHLRNQS